MPKTDEKLADILAEMRKAVVPMICGRPKIEAVSIGDVLQWADRIEAAAEREREKSERKFTDAKYEIKGLVDISEHLLEDIGRVSIARAAGEEPSDDDMEAFTERILKMRERIAHAERKFLQEDGGAKCVNGLRGEPDCRGCNEHCEDVRKRNCFYWNPDVEGGVCALTGKKSCPISCDNLHIPENVSPPPAEGEKE